MINIDDNLLRVKKIAISGSTLITTWGLEFTMEGTDIAIYLGLAIFALILVGWFFSVWNRLVRLEKDVDRAWANIDTLLQQRFDMIPNMVTIVKQYADHEKGIFGELNEARKTFSAASKSGDVSGVMAAEAMASLAMPKLLALSEDYPDLKANVNFAALQDDYKEIEDSVTDQRQLYNSSATNFNTAIEIIPDSIVASIKGCKERILYEADQKARGSVSIEF